jgi:hypothetical protein
MAGKRELDEPRLDQLFAEPIVKQLMHRDRIDEATIRRLLRQAAVARAAPSEPQAEQLLAPVMGSPLLAGIAGASRCHHLTRLAIPVRHRKRAGC